jgi:uncharacterized protein
MATAVRIAAAGDIHCSPESRDRLACAFGSLAGDVDLFLLAGDLTTLGEPEQAQPLADICRDLETPVIAVLGNHDWHANKVGELVEILEGAGVAVLDPGTRTCEIDGMRVGIVGTKGFVGGFPDSQLPDFGEPILRQVYRDTTAEVDAIATGLAAVDGCDYRIVLLHYAPTTTTLDGEPRVIWAFLGTDRMAAPISERRPDVVLHGHAHRGTFQGFIGDVPVYNVAIEVMKRDFFVFELADGELRPLAPESPSGAGREVPRPP